MTVHWHKSSRSDGAKACVEVAQLSGLAAVRDSKLGEASPILTVTAAQFARFTNRIKRGELL